MNNWDSLGDDAKVWFYGSQRTLTPHEQTEIKNYLDQFCSTWAAHGAQLNCGFNILHDRFIVLAVDEASASATGCSIDKSVHAFQEIDSNYQLDLFNRLRSYQLVDNAIQPHDSTSIKSGLKTGKITARSSMINPLVSNLGQVRRQLVQPLSDTWLSKYLNSVE
ncbi:MAG: hypothetical protein JJ975_01585 [Bacteroidia bacterium]|nr:hypothetical protein [Bacteroidia bacterium]